MFDSVDKYIIALGASGIFKNPEWPAQKWSSHIITIGKTSRNLFIRCISEWFCMVTNTKLDAHMLRELALRIKHF